MCVQRTGRKRKGSCFTAWGRASSQGKRKERAGGAKESIGRQKETGKKCFRLCCDAFRPNQKMILLWRLDYQHSNFGSRKNTFFFVHWKYLTLMKIILGGAAEAGCKRESSERKRRSETERSCCWGTSKLTGKNLVENPSKLCFCDAKILKLRCFCAFMCFVIVWSYKLKKNFLSSQLY